MALLKLEAVRKAFGGLVAVNDLGFEVGEAEIVGLIGPNGAGKTTVFNLISGFLVPEAGRIFFEGQEITGRRPYDISALGVGRTFQIAKPFAHLTVLDNVVVGCLSRLPSIEQARREAGRILEEVKLDRRARQVAQHLNVPERKRLELARALSITPRLILLDEVMAGINAAETQELVAIVRRVRERGVAVLVIEHVMRAVMSLADRIVVLNYGVKIAEGGPDDVGRNERVVEAYLGARYSVA